MDTKPKSLRERANGTIARIITNLYGAGFVEQMEIEYLQAIEQAIGYERELRIKAERDTDTWRKRALAAEERLKKLEESCAST